MTGEPGKTPGARTPESIPQGISSGGGVGVCAYLGGRSYTILPNEKKSHIGNSSLF